jgi:histidinol-phosphate aminotransferase
MTLAPSQLVREEILALSSYHVSDSLGLTKLDAMENPYRLPLPLRETLARELAQAELNRYPDPQGRQLKALIRESMSVPEEMGILLGNGSDELIQMLVLALARPGAALLTVEPTFVMYRLIAAFAGMRHVGVPLKPDFTLDPDIVLKTIGEQRPALIFLAYPNNPTGNLFDVETVRCIIEAAPGLVVVDEAYTAFAGASLLGDMRRYPNLLVMRTLSKLGLAGLRLGYLVARAEWLTELDKVRLPYNINVLTQTAASFALRNLQVLNEQARLIREARGRLAESLSQLTGVHVFPSAANFLLFRVAAASDIYAGLLRRAVLIKNLHGTHPLLDNCLRVTVGTPEENACFLDACEQALREVAAHA